MLLTEQRENVLNGEYSGTDAALRNQKSRLRESSRTALHELTAVAESQHIDNTDVFDPDDVFRLLRALLSYDGPQAIEGTEQSVYEPPSGQRDADYADEFAAYRNRLQVQMAKLIIGDTFTQDATRGNLDTPAEDDSQT